MGQKKVSKKTVSIVSADTFPMSCAFPVPSYAKLGDKIKNTLTALPQGQCFDVPVEAEKALAYRLTKFPPRTFTIKTHGKIIRVWKL